MQGERRIVTVLFCDVAGSTAMAERLDPEEWTEVMNEAFEYFTAPISRYEGTVARLLGDAILAFFGAPFSHEDDPQRAIFAGLEIIEGIQPFREQMKRERGLDFNVRVGINTGPVVVGDVGSNLASEYTAMGDAVNLAARMEQTAQPGTVQVSGATHKLVEPLFEFEALGAIEVKGKAEPVPAYRVLARKAAPGRLRGIAGLSAPLVGRSSELEKLRETIAAVRQGSGQIVCLIGEAGLGKSRLLEEQRARWQTEGGSLLTWAESRGVSYDSTRPYSLFVERMRQFFGIEEGDSPDAMRQKMAAGLLLQNLAPEQLVACTVAVESMLAIRKGSSTPELPPDVLKREVFNNMLQGWRVIASQGPAAMVFDDLHWADPASAELIMHLFQIVEEAPVLVLLAFRPERQSPAWRIKQYAETEYPHRYLEIVLKPLSSQDTDALVSNLLAIADLPIELRQLILSKAEGNPFFVEEVVRTLIDAGAVIPDETGMRWHAATKVEDISIPDNLQSLLMARIDRLETEARHTLQMASVIGRSFYQRVLKVVSDTATALDKQLVTLQKVELIREATRHPELEYIFRHELTRDAAYGSILRRRRREFHRRVGEAIEALFPERLEEEAHRLALHFREAGDIARALKYYTLAGDAAARLNANTEAITHYTHALEAAKGDAASDQQSIHLHTRRGRALELSSHYDEALVDYQELENLGGQRNVPALVLAALVAQATIYSTYTVMFDPDRGQALSERALRLAKELKDPRAEAKALWNLTLLEIYAKQNMMQAVFYGEQSLAIARQNNFQEELPYILNDLSPAYATLNQKERALAATEEARELWRAQGNSPMVGDSLFKSAEIHGNAGEFDKAELLAEEALRLGQSIDSPWVQVPGLAILGVIYAERGESEKAIKALQQAIPLAERGNFAVGRVFTSAILARLYGLLGDTDSGITLAQSALATPAETSGYRQVALAVLASLQRLQGDTASAETTIAKAQEGIGPVELQSDLGYLSDFTILHLTLAEFALARQEHQHALGIASSIVASMQASGVRVYLPDALGLKAQALLAMGQSGEARNLLTQARAEAEALGSRRALWPVLALLSQLETQRGNVAEARELLAQAREVVAYIADHAGTPELRASFLALPQVRAVFATV